MAEALDFAIQHSNDYQSQREDLYMQALDLSYARFLYTPIFSGTGNVADEHQMKDADQIAGSAVTGSGIKDDQDVSASGKFSASALMRTGGKITASFTSDFLRFVSGDPRVVGNSALTAELTQPLLQGAGHTVAMLAIGEGASSEAQDQIKNLGSQNIIIRSTKPPDDQKVANNRQNFVLDFGLKPLDVQRIEATIPRVEIVVPARIIRDYVWHGFDSQVLNIGVFQQRSLGFETTHNPRAYTFLLRRP